MRFLLVAVCLACLWAIPSPSGAFGKITVDPNQPSTHGAQSAVEGDPRLAQLVTYETAPKSVVRILEELSKITGVALNAGYNKLDWQVRDRKMVLCVKSIPLAELMRSIARVMKFTWSKSPDVDPPTYRLYINRALLLEAGRLLQDQDEKVRQHRVEKRAEELGNLLAAADLPPDQMAKLKESHPALYALCASGVPKPLSELLQAAPEVYEALAAGKEMVLPIASLSPGAQAILPALSKAFQKVRLYQGTAPQDELNLDDSRALLLLNWGEQESEDDPIGGRFRLGGIAVSVGGSALGAGIPNAEALYDASLVRVGIEAVEQQRDYKDVFKEMKDKTFLEYARGLKNDESGEALIQHDDDPSLDAKIELKAEDQQLKTYEKALTTASDFSVVSDYFGARNALVPVTKTKLAIHDVLRQLQDGFHYNWERHGSLVEFRDRYWYRRRSEQIPDAWIEDWRETLKKTGTLCLGQLVQLSKLTQAQWEMNIALDGELAGYNAGQLAPFAQSGQPKALLKIYDSLTDDQRKTLFDVGIDSSCLSADAWLIAEKLLVLNPLFLQQPRNKIVLKAASSQADRSMKYTFAFSCEGLDAVVLSFQSPRYAKPKADTEKSPTKGGEAPATKTGG